ncbi:energy transducer TonB [uncultured Umboniibacter sp.]|uniref:energy transducer TonB n=1 Tax=uncultured Umboniibacter sp. TaxID=1798917 RepID=UPI00261332CD|nr:energy transducer TonB [uncultured Umboniibacter sp.]
MLATLVIAAAVAAPGNIDGTSSTQTRPEVETAQDMVLPGEVARSVSEFIEPQIVRPVAPRYPRTELRREREGWATVSYVIDTEGNVAHAVIEDSSGSSHFEREALKAALKRKYEPAMLNGEPIESCDNSNMFTFEIGNSSQGGSSRFVNISNDAVEAYKAEDFVAFSEFVGQLDEMELTSFYEEANYRLLSGLNFEQQGDSISALSEYQRAISWGANDWGPDRLSADNTTILFQRAFAIMLDSQQYLDAVELAEKIPGELRNEEGLSSLLELAETLELRLAEQEYLIAKGDLSERGTWSYRLSRPVFEFAVESGEISAFELRCSGKYKRYDYQGQGAFTIPSTWGECSVRLEGQVNSQVSLYQFNS